MSYHLISVDARYQLPIHSFGVELGSVHANSNLEACQELLRDRDLFDEL